MRNNNAIYNRNHLLVRNRNTSWISRRSKSSNDNNDNNDNNDILLSSPVSERIEKYDDAATLIIPDPIRSLIISKINSNITNNYYQSFLWKDPNPILWNQFQRELVLSRNNTIITTNDDDVTINLQIGFVINLSDNNNNDDIFKHGLKQEAKDDYVFFTKSISTALSKLEEQTSFSISTSNILVVLFNPNTDASISLKRNIPSKRKNRMMLWNSNNNNLLLPIGLLQQKVLALNINDYLHRKRRKEELEIEFYKKTICTLKQQAKQVRTKDNILKALLLLNDGNTEGRDDNTLQQSKKTSLFILPDIKKASKYYKKSYTRNNNCRLSLEIKREISHHISTKLLSSVKILDDTIIQQHYFPRLPSPYSRAVVDDMCTILPKSTKEIKKRIQRIRTVLNPLLVLQKKRQQQQQQQEESKEEDKENENNNYLSSFSSYYQPLNKFDDNDNCNDEDNENDFLSHPLLPFQEKRQLEESKEERDSENENKNYISLFSSYYNYPNNLDDYGDKDNGGVFLLNTPNRRRRHTGRKRFSSININNIASDHDEKEREGTINFHGVQFISNNFRNLINKIAMYFSQDQQLVQDNYNYNDNDCYGEIKDDNNNYNENNNDNNDVRGFLGFRSLSSSSLVPIESILQYSSSSSSNIAPTEEYLQLCLSNNHHHKKTKLSHSKDNMINIMNEVRCIQSIPASSVTIGDALVVMMKQKRAK